MQLRKAESEGVCIVAICLEDIFDNDKMKYIADKTISILQSDKDVIVTTAYEYDSDQISTLFFEKNEIPRKLGAVIIRNQLANLTKIVMEKSLVSGLFITGGHIAIGVLENLAIKQSIILKEVEPGVPLLACYDRDKTNLVKVVTKAGGFGTAEVILNGIKAIKERS